MVEADEDRRSPAVAEAEAEADTGTGTETETEGILSAGADSGWARFGDSWGWGAFVRRNIPIQQPEIGWMASIFSGWWFWCFPIIGAIAQRSEKF